MRRFSLAGLFLVLVMSATSSAGPITSWLGGGHGGDGLAGFGRGGGLFHRRPLGGFWSGGWFGPGYGSWFDAGDWMQDRFETRLDNFKSDYDEAVAEDPDFYTSDEYDDMVERLDRLTDRYDRFVSFEQSAIEGLGTCIDNVNDRLDDLDEWLAENPDHQWLQKHLTRVTDWLTDKVDLLTERQKSLSASLEDHLAFQTELEAYYNEVANAGNPPAEMAALLATVDPASGENAAVAEAAAMAATAAPLGRGTVASVPEPMSIVLLAPAAMLLLTLRRRPHNG